MTNTAPTKYAAGDRVRISLNPRPAIGDFVSPSFAGAIGTIESSETSVAGSYRVRVGTLVQYVSPESLSPEGQDEISAAILRAEMAATYKGQAEGVTIPKADLLLILGAARR